MCYGIKGDKVSEPADRLRHLLVEVHQGGVLGLSEYNAGRGGLLKRKVSSVRCQLSGVNNYV